MPWDVNVLTGQLMSFSAFWKKDGMNISHFYLWAKHSLKVGSLAKGAAPHTVTTMCLPHYIERCLKYVVVIAFIMTRVPHEWIVSPGILCRLFSIKN